MNVERQDHGSWLLAIIGQLVACPNLQCHTRPLETIGHCKAMRVRRTQGTLRFPSCLLSFSPTAWLLGADRTEFWFRPDFDHDGHVVVVGLLSVPGALQGNCI